MSLTPFIFEANAFCSELFCFFFLFKAFLFILVLACRALDETYPLIKYTHARMSSAPEIIVILAAFIALNNVRCSSLNDTDNDFHLIYVY